MWCKPPGLRILQVDRATVLGAAPAPRPQDAGDRSASRLGRHQHPRRQRTTVRCDCGLVRDHSLGRLLHGLTGAPRGSTSTERVVQHEGTRLPRARPARWESVPDPTILEPTDAIVRIDSSTICGTDLHILKGDVPEVTPGTILGHEAVGTVDRDRRGASRRSPSATACSSRASRRADAAASARRPSTASAPAAAAGSSAT